MDDSPPIEPQPAPSHIHFSWEQYLKLAAVPYAFGFLTVMFHTARYGFPVIQLIQPLNFWVGSIPTLVLAVIWKGVQITARTPWNRHMNKAIKRFGFPIVKIVSLSVIIASFGLGLLMVYMPTFYGRYFLFPDVWSVGGQILVLFSLLCSTAVISAFDDKKRLNYTDIAVCAWLAFLILAIYVTGIYPRLPQRYGFGEPSNVKMVLDPKMAPPELLESKPMDSFSPVVSRSVKLLYRTDKEDLILCDQCQSKSLSVNSAGVVGIIWEAGGRGSDVQSQVSGTAPKQSTGLIVRP